MSITDILIRSISGYVFIVPGLLLYFIIFKKTNKNQMPLHIATVFVFCYYLIGVLTMTGIGKLKVFEPTIVLIPFRDMISGPIDTILNVVLFAPLGFFRRAVRSCGSCRRSGSVSRISGKMRKLRLNAIRGH